jgi:hypothetical protein
VADVRIEGGDALAAVARRLRSADKSLKREFTKSLRAEALPLAREAHAALVRQAPNRGGLARQVAQDRPTVSVRTGASAAVRIQAGRRGGASRMLNTGAVRHPVFGRPDSWVTQQVPAAEGEWTDVLEQGEQDVQQALLRAMETVLERVARGG